jgi:hypothetical protein
MKVRFGAILCLILGFVLIQGGLTSGGSSTVGAASPCLTVGAVGFCPVGSLTVNEVTDANGNSSVTPPASWSVTLSSTNCTVAGEPTKTIDNNGSATWTGLYVYTNSDFTAQCEYSLAEDESGVYTASFDPPPPYTFLDELNQQGAFRAHANTAQQSVNLTNTAPKAATSSSASSSAASSSASSSAAPSATATVPTTAPSFSASSSPVLATTGPHRPVRGSLIAGIALVLFGGFLLLAGRRPRQARHG